ncbi:unnamed protein product [Brassica oleracea var. botrytis]
MLTRICAMNLFCFSQWCIYVILSYLFSLQLTVALTKNGEDERGDLKPAFIAAGGNLILEGARRLKQKKFSFLLQSFPNLNGLGEEGLLDHKGIFSTR